MLKNYLKNHWPIISIIIILSFVYLETLLPTLGYSGDTTKLQFVGRYLGTIHATGYPAYLIINHLFTKFFLWGSLAYKANLLSAILAILGVCILYRLLLVLKIRKIIAFITALTFGVTPTFWSQAIVAEVYTLNALFIVTTFYFFIQWGQNKRDKYFFLACAFYAFSFGNHLTVVTFLPAIIYYVWMIDKRVFRDFTKIVGVLILIILGALQYYYLFWRFNVPVEKTVFLEMQINDWSTFWHYVTGAQFTPKMFSLSIRELVATRIPMYLTLLFKEYLFLLPVLAVGYFKMKKNKVLHAFLLLGFFVNWFYAINYDIRDIFVYFIPGYLLLSLYIGKGMDFIFDKIPQKAVLAGTIILFIIPTLFLYLNWNQVDQSKKTEMDTRIRKILTAVQSDAIIIAPDYYYTQYLYYYLIGVGLEKNDLFVLFHFDANAIKAYLQSGQPLYIPEKRKLTPSNLSVYLVNDPVDDRDDFYQPKLQQAGLSLEAIQDDLYSVKSPSL